MGIREFFIALAKSDDAFGDTKQNLFGFVHNESRRRYVSDGKAQVIEVDEIDYMKADSAFGEAYDLDLASTEKLSMFCTIFDGVN
jgi:hypothetical protein